MFSASARRLLCITELRAREYRHVVPLLASGGCLSLNAADVRADGTTILCKSCRKRPDTTRRAARFHENEHRGPWRLVPWSRIMSVDDVKMATRIWRCPKSRVASYYSRASRRDHSTGIYYFNTRVLISRSN